MEYAKYLENAATKAPNPQLEREEERLSGLEAELFAVNELEFLAFDLKDEMKEYYENEIAACKRNINYFEGCA
ncbi:hypothetical protein [Christensenella minuta]|uniref:hypothetical protein n=1 Tax=Christensenella minuta TaxID=626937 RepID=UPI002A83CAB0|nr:hypothetical protein [Christensenella minuta]MDY3750536.1 hypothetical protein [Christensenella minuta]